MEDATKYLIIDMTLHIIASEVESMERKRSIYLAIVTMIGLFWFWGLSMHVGTPPVLQLIWFNPDTTSYMRNDPNPEIKHEWRPLSKISPYLKRAVVEAEDDLFYEHQGFDWEAMKRAAEYNLKKKRFARGASTITMQVARNLFLTPDKSLLRKFRELLIALKLERELSKDRILEIYLNVVEWGNGIYGAEAAARHYFGKNATNLTPYEAAYLASILPKPKFYDRHRGSGFPKRRATSIMSRI